MDSVQRLLEWGGEVLLAWAVIAGQEEAVGLHLATDKQAEQSLGDTRGAGPHSAGSSPLMGELCLLIPLLTYTR